MSVWPQASHFSQTSAGISRRSPWGCLGFFSFLNHSIPQMSRLASEVTTAEGRGEGRGEGRDQGGAARVSGEWGEPRGEGGAGRLHQVRALRLIREPFLGADQNAAEFGELLESKFDDLGRELVLDGAVPRETLAQRSECDSEEPGSINS